MSDQSLIPEGIHSLPDYIEQKLRAYGALPAYTALGKTLSFREVDEKSVALASWLQHQNGLNEGDRIAIQLPNILQNPIAVYGALRAGLVVVNTNPLYTAKEMAHQFKDSGAKALIILSDFLPKYEEIKHQTQIETVISTGIGDLLSDKASPTEGDIYSFTEVLQAGKELPLKARSKQNVDDVCMLQYTGGTTGVSKGAALSHGNILSNSVQTLDRLGASFEEGREVVVCPLPLYHIYAFTVCMMTFFAKGCLTVLIPNPRDLDAFVSQMKPFPITTFCGLNTLFIGLCQHAEFKQMNFANLKLTISGGTALTQAAVDIWKEVTTCSITEGYGLSETAPVLTFNQPGNEKVGTVGPPLLGTDIQLLDENDQPVEGDESGQIAAKGPQVMLGYWNREEETKKVMTQSGYFKTGDVGVRTEEGCIKIIDRLKDLVIVSGFNVYPNEVENVLASHPCVLEAAVIGKSDERTGERVCAFITVSETVSEDALISHCKKSLTGYKVPKEFHIVQELPKSTVGKVLRRELRQAS
ncbi:AMP-binding protein [Aestuariibacter sp. AA17]|uniref:Long-chain-fatty-acid--CoA ligase n=1 Tax=Fluctibacter corallii TaxID=2984329 RepID=A0ABT3A504_9ALTE|nr:AMP-binding protein [Aestuariibacter sp. AA17]MCV2883761.1 AMP-binding protein [Aestuariibacter sp. AA17]